MIQALIIFFLSLFRKNLSPFLGSISDRGGYRKIFLLFFTLIASIFSILLFLPSAGDVFLALSIFTIANISFELGHVFYNSYLIDITNKDIFYNQVVTIAGGGDSALDWAVTLAKDIASKVYLIHRRDSFRAMPKTISEMNIFDQNQ